MKIQSPYGVTENAIRDFRLSLAKKNLKKNTQSYYVIAIRNFLKFLLKRKIKVLSPEMIELPKVTRRDIETLDYGEMERLLKAPQGNDLRSLRDKAILETLFSTGLRVSEICALNRYLDLNRGEISVRGKGDKLRVVFLSDGTKSAVKEYLNKRTDMEEALFVSLSKSSNSKSTTYNLKPKTSNTIGRIIPRAVQRLVDYYSRKAGIQKKVHPHQLRHSFATDLLINGADMRSRSRLKAIGAYSNVSTQAIRRRLSQISSSGSVRKAMMPNVRPATNISLRRSLRR